MEASPEVTGGFTSGYLPLLTELGKLAHEANAIQAVDLQLV